MTLGRMLGIIHDFLLLFQETTNALQVSVISFSNREVVVPEGLGVKCNPWKSSRPPFFIGSFMNLVFVQIKGL